MAETIYRHEQMIELRSRLERLAVQDFSGFDKGEIEAAAARVRTVNDHLSRHLDRLVSEMSPAIQRILHRLFQFGERL